MTNPIQQLRQRFHQWLFRPSVDSGTITLVQRRIFILPTLQGLAFVIVLTMMLLGSVNYNLSLGYILTFLLATIAIMSALFAFRNLSQLEIRAGRNEPVFCGDMVNFKFHFRSRSARYQIYLQDDKRHTIHFDLADDNPTHLMLDYEIFFPQPSEKRGWQQCSRLKLFTEFPLGLFHAWSWIQFDHPCLIYARPAAQAELPGGHQPDMSGKAETQGDEDFNGLRNYIPGDTLTRISWKSYAREQPLQVKQFSTPVGQALQLNLEQAPGNTLEQKLSIMTRWVLDAESEGLLYSLHLPDADVPVGQGLSHRNECLKSIALHQQGGKT